MSEERSKIEAVEMDLSRNGKFNIQKNFKF